jgi:hypothetical protein
MLQPLILALAVSAALFIGYLLLRAYKPRWFGSAAVAKEDMYVEPAATAAPGPAATATEEFVAPVARPPEATKINTARPPVPAPAPPVTQDPPMEPREVAPGGPHAPNARAARGREASMSPEATPLDPYDDRNMEAPIHDSMRHPELSFGPGVENTSRGTLAAAGTGSAVALTAETGFSPEFAQNGASFMGSVFANDLHKGDSYATV